MTQLIKTTEHDWKKNEYDEIDMFAMSYEFHNGAVCNICLESFCEHCHPDWETRTTCVEHYICPNCGKHFKDSVKACSECGTVFADENKKE